jgi:hypothetical protein
MTKINGSPFPIERLFVRNGTGAVDIRPIQVTTKGGSTATAMFIGKTPNGKALVKTELGKKALSPDTLVSFQ